MSVYGFGKPFWRLAALQKLMFEHEVEVCCLDTLPGVVWSAAYAFYAARADRRSRDRVAYI